MYYPYAVGSLLGYEKVKVEEQISIIWIFLVPDLITALLSFKYSLYYRKPNIILR